MKNIKEQRKLIIEIIILLFVLLGLFLMMSYYDNKDNKNKTEIAINYEKS